VVVKDIVELIDDTLYSVKWEGEEHHSLSECLNKLTDAEWLYKFLDDNRDVLEKIDKGPLKYKRIEDIVYYTNEGVRDMEELFFNEDVKLDSLFENLGGNDFFEYDPQKAKGSRKWGWIRIYAIKNDYDQYFITGFAIKLTGKMKEHSSTRLELDKMKLVDKYLKQTE